AAQRPIQAGIHARGRVEAWPADGGRRHCKVCAEQLTGKMGNYYLYLLASVLTRALPMRFSYAMAVLLADCHYWLSSADRRAVESNLKVILKVNEVPPAMVR